jgi:hypothetical protein
MTRRTRFGHRTVLVVAAVAGALLVVPAPAEADQAAGVGQGRIVFGGETESGTQLWTVWPDGTHLRQITHLAGDTTNPDWSA